MELSDIAVEGLYVYSGGERGWVERQHSYTLAGGVLAHTEDCLPYDLPKPTARGSIAITYGPLAVRGA